MVIDFLSSAARSLEAPGNMLEIVWLLRIEFLEALDRSETNESYRLLSWSTWVPLNWFVPIFVLLLSNNVPFLSLSIYWVRVFVSLAGWFGIIILLDAFVKPSEDERIILFWFKVIWLWFMVLFKLKLFYYLACFTSHLLISSYLLGV